MSSANNQSGPPSSAVAVRPSVLVSDADANPVPGVAVTFAIATGGGTVTGGDATTDASGIATVGAWNLGGAPGPNSLTATAAALPGTTITFLATATLVSLTAISPPTLTSGVTATITGAGFSATIASNAVTIDGLPASVTAATPTSLTVTVPTLPCTPAHTAIVSVSVAGGPAGTRSHPVRAGTLRSLAVGQSVIIATADESRCNELANTGGLYYVTVRNTSTVYSPFGPAFELKGAAGVVGSVVNSNVARAPLRSAIAPRPMMMAATDASDAAHIRHLERSLAVLRQHGPRWRATRTAPAADRRVFTAHAVGDPFPVRLPNINANFCNDYIDLTGRVAYVGTRSIIVEDNANPLAGTIDTTYAQIGAEVDAVMWPILETNFGNALVNDATLDNNGRIVMVFSRTINTLFPGIAGFVSPCDFFPRSVFASSNQGEFFYAIAPGAAGPITTPDSPPRWRWSMRSTVIHEVKHIVSTAERFFRSGGTVFEESWLEETTARMSEELYERARYGFLQRANIGYGSAGNPVGPWCGLRLSCGQARGIVRVFEDLAPQWYTAPHNYSPIGRIDDGDFSFYATGWSLVRWGVDASANQEATILRGMTQDPSRTGLANFEFHTGIPFATALPKWTMAMILDDYPAFAPADPTLRQPSWDLRNVFAGLKTDFPTVPWLAWPLAPYVNTFGDFTRPSTVRAGTTAIIELSGTQSATQLLELKAQGFNGAAPAELRLAIVRVQ
jgi:hypothetical protein